MDHEKSKIRNVSPKMCLCL